MSLVVVDQFRMTADSYVTHLVNETEKGHSGYRKIHALEGQVRYEDRLSYCSVSFIGDADVFEMFHERLKTALYPSRPLDAQRLTHMVQGLPEQRCTIIFPFENAALRLVIDPNAAPCLMLDEGSVLGYGSAYTPQYDPVMGEYRAWFAIFLDAVREGTLPGNDVHFATHNNDPNTKTIVRDDTLVPSNVVNRMKRGLRLGRRGVERRKRAKM